MIGEHPKRRHHEPTVQSPNRQRALPCGSAALLEQLLQSLELAFVVAQDQSGGMRAEQRAEPVEVAVDPLGRKEPELEVGLLRPAASAAGNASMCERQSSGPSKMAVPARHQLAQPAGDLQVMLRFVPRPGHFVEIRPEGLLDDDGVGGEKLKEGAAGGRKDVSTFPLSLFPLFPSPLLALRC